MKKYLITGGAGFIGSHTVVELAQAGYVPVVIDNFSNAERGVLDGLAAILGKSPTFYEGDCCDLRFMRNVFQIEKDIAGAIHFAALKAVGDSVKNPLTYYHNNLNGLLTLLHVMNENEVRHLVFSSSATVYGTPDELPLTEESPVKSAISPYGNTKQISEAIIRDVVTSQVPLKSVALRYFNPIGAHPSGLIGELPLGVPNNLIPFITQTAAGLREKLVVYGNDYDTPDGTCVRDYIHVVDLAQAHVKALNYLAEKKADGFMDIFNIGTGQGNSVLDVIQTFETVTGQKLKYEIGPRRPGDSPSTYANVDKAARDLGWRTALTLDDALKDAWHWERKRKDGYR